MKGAEVSIGEASAQSDEKGVAVLTVGSAEDAKEAVTVAAKNYRTEKVTLDPASKQVIKSHHGTETTISLCIETNRQIRRLQNGH